MPSSPARQGGYLSRPGASSLAQVVETILDKGLVIDAYVRVNLLGIELVTVDARFVVASADTYLRYAEAVDRLELEPKATSPFDLEEKAAEKYVEGTVKGVVEGAQEGVGDLVQEVKDSVQEVAGEVADKLRPDR